MGQICCTTSTFSTTAIPKCDIPSHQLIGKGQRRELWNRAILPSAHRWCSFWALSSRWEARFWELVDCVDGTRFEVKDISLSPREDERWIQNRAHCQVALKIFTHDGQDTNKIAIYKCIGKGKQIRTWLPLCSHFSRLNWVDEPWCKTFMSSTWATLG